MKISRAQFSLIAFALLWLLGGRLHAHQLGVDSVFLEEMADHQYRLTYKASPGSAEAQGRPVLPPQCQWNEESEGAPSGIVGLKFTSGEKPLLATDGIILPWKRNGVLFTALWHDGTQARQFFMSGDQGITVQLAMLKAGSGTFLQTAGRYLQLGIGHILNGLDHLLFVAGLLLLVKGTRRLVMTITAFTLAHSITLALSVLGQFRLPGEIVESLVALSIVFLAVENVYAWRGKVTLAAKFPWIVSFGFGLVHGLGFAGALNSLGLPTREIPLALLFFNCGVEIGQLLFVGAWLTVIQIIRSAKLHIPARASLAATYALGILSTCWFLERLLPLL